MEICEGCIKQDVCKFKKEVEKYEMEDSGIPEPLFPFLNCKYKRTEPPNWTYTGTTTHAPCCGDDITLTSGTTWGGDYNYRC